jgi:hypothetical protein
MIAGLGRLFERRRPHFGIFALWATLLVAGRLARLLAPERGISTGEAITVLSRLPDAARLSPSLQSAAVTAFAVCALLWLFQAVVPWSAVGAASAFTVAVALAQEQSVYVDHMFHLVNVTLWVLALWYLICRREMRAALRDGTFWIQPLFPNWVYGLLVFHVGWFYTLAGVAKLADSGLAWPNGVSLQLWTLAWGRPGALAAALLGSRSLATALQVASLSAEVTALPLALFRRTRSACGLALLAFHAGQELLFGWWFVGNMVVVAVTLLPAARWIHRAADALTARGEPPPALPQWLWARIDIRGRYAPATRQPPLR